MRPPVTSCKLVWALLVPLLLSCGPSVDRRLSGSWRGAEVNGWIPVRLQGSPGEIGFQHGYLLAPEIADALKVIQLVVPHETKRDWAFLRAAAETIFWPRVDEEYRQELRGISEGLAARGVKATITDIVVLNAFLEMSYYTDTPRGEEDLFGAGALQRVRGHRQLDARRPARDRAQQLVRIHGRVALEHHLRHPPREGVPHPDGRLPGPDPQRRRLRDELRGRRHHRDHDLAVQGVRTNGIPEFVRARKAMQYAASIDDFVRIMANRNNGGYANAWLVADTKRNEIARLELGLKNVTLERTSDGYFVGANFPVNPKLAGEETSFRVDNPDESRNVRRTRWEQLMPEFKGQHRRRDGQAVHGGPLRRLREEGRRPERAHAVRARGPLAARFEALAGAVRPGRHGPGQGRGRRDGAGHGDVGRHGPSVRAGFRGRGVPEAAPGVRLAEGASQGPALAVRGRVSRRDNRSSGRQPR